MARGWFPLGIIFLGLLVLPLFSAVAQTDDEIISGKASTPVLDSTVAPTPAPTPDPKAYILTERISVATGSGLFVAPVGSMVTLVSKDESGLVVLTDDGFKLNVTMAQVTQDPAKIDALKKEIAAAKAAAEARHNADVAAAQAVQNAQLTQQEKFSNAVTAITPTPTPSPTPPALTGAALDQTPVSTSAVYHKK